MTRLPHQIHGALTEFVLEIVPLDHSDAVLARCRALELDRSLYHPVDELLGDVTLFVVVEDDRCGRQCRPMRKGFEGLQWKFPSPTCPTIVPIRPLLSMSSFVSSMMVGS